MTTSSTLDSSLTDPALIADLDVRRSSAVAAPCFSFTPFHMCCGGTAAASTTRSDSNKSTTSDLDDATFAERDMYRKIDMAAATTNNSPSSITGSLKKKSKKNNSWWTLVGGKDQAEVIPDLEDHQQEDETEHSSEEDDGSTSTSTSTSTTADSSPSSSSLVEWKFRDPSTMLVQLAKLILSMVFMESTFGRMKRGQQKAKEEGEQQDKASTTNSSKMEPTAGDDSIEPVPDIL